MGNELQSIKLTKEDKLRYEKQIAEIDISIKEKILLAVPAKLNNLMLRKRLSGFQITLIEDITKLYTLLKSVPNLDVQVQRRILFALQYFYDSNDDIPDSTPEIGYLDDAVVAHWIAKQTLSDYSKYFEA